VAIDSVETRDPAILALIAEITSARIDLLASVDELKEQMTPAAFRRRGLSLVTGAFVDDQGGIRPKRVATVAGVLVGVLALNVLRRIRRS
jgi:hypothetical protein